MAAIQMSELLKRCQQFHHRLAEHYEEMEHEVRRANVRAMLDFMARHERHLEQCLALYEKTAAPNVAHAWFRVAPHDEAKRLLHDDVVDPDMGVEDVIDMAMRFDECLVRMYRRLAESTQNTALKEALENLLALEEREEARLAWDLQQG
ncbi:MAG: hypothetical protein ACLFTT_05385 [Candidatus Hydrogenedentota bacterium]